MTLDPNFNGYPPAGTRVTEMAPSGPMKFSEVTAWALTVMVEIALLGECREEHRPRKRCPANHGGQQHHQRRRLQRPQRLVEIIFENVWTFRQDGAEVAERSRDQPADVPRFC